MTEAEKHRLYAAALAATDSPLDSDLFKSVCRKIDIFDEENQPNPKYPSFVSDHIHWSMAVENRDFRNEINTRDKAVRYVQEHLRG